MKTVADIIKAMTKVLNESFPDAKVWSTDKDEDFGKKCFFIQYTANTDGKDEFAHDYGAIRLYYFPSDDKINRIELLNTQNALSKLFLNRFFLDDSFAIPITELDFSISDDVLEMSFEYEMYQFVDVDADLPTMETLVEDLEN